MGGGGKRVQLTPSAPSTPGAGRRAPLLHARSPAAATHAAPARRPPWSRTLLVSWHCESLLSGARRWCLLLSFSPRLAPCPRDSVCLSVVLERRPKFGSKRCGARCSFERRQPKFLHRPKRLVDMTATQLLALQRHKSRRRRAPRPAAGPPTHAIAGTRARAVTMATVRPPSLLNHSRRLPGGWQAAVRHEHTSVVSRRRVCSSRDGGVE